MGRWRREDGGVFQMVLLNHRAPTYYVVSACFHRYYSTTGLLLHSPHSNGNPVIPMRQARRVERLTGRTRRRCWESGGVGRGGGGKGGRAEYGGSEKVEKGGMGGGDERVEVFSQWYYLTIKHPFNTMRSLHVSIGIIQSEYPLTI